MAPFPGGYSTRQGASSTTWSCPPLDASLTLPQVVDWHYTHSPNHPFFVYSKSEEEQEPSVITWKDAALSIHHTARSFIDLVGNGSRCIIAVLAVAGMCNHIILEIIFFLIISIQILSHMP
jgi:hypothetical protein